ncbi:MAG: M14 family metallopeptidase [Vicinamibacterales bacterium]|nr:M14 family metallopeptidase [Vicinamibacterales bacterium]
MRFPATLVLLLTLGPAVTIAQPPAAPRTHAEITNFEETTSYADVLRFVNDVVEASPLARSERFGASEEDRVLPLLMLSDPGIVTPAEARKLGRPIVLVMANIHAGEVEGKEAALMLARRLTTGDLQPLLTQAVVLIAPIYNADGNERVSLDNRRAQNGPVGGVGTRENAKGLDLNRDFMKLDSAEARSLVGLLNRWDPHVIVDLHTTNGSYHAYHLTYAPPLNPNTDPRLTAFARERLLPTVRQTTEQRHGVRTYYYGNFTTEAGTPHPPLVDPARPGDVVWRTFDHRPRFGTNYAGLRNRLAVLSEAYSYVDFARRVRSTEAFVEEVLRYVAAHGKEIQTLIAQVDRDTADGARAGTHAPLGVEFVGEALPDPVEILVSDVRTTVNPRSGHEMREMTEQVSPVRMKDYGLFGAARTVPMPRGWLIPGPSVANGRLTLALERLRVHGVVIEELAADATVEVERFFIEGITRAERPFQGRYETRLRGRMDAARFLAPAGSLFVPAGQPLGRLAFYLLEAESDDGFVTWNVIDDGLAAGETYPIYRVTNATPLKLK